MSYANRKRWVMNNRVKARAHQAVRDAIKSGRLVRPPKCSKCHGRRGRIEAHHANGYDYANRLRVVWLCRPCHEKTVPLKKFCKRGHRLSGRNLKLLKRERRRNPERVCRTCALIHVHNRRNKMRAKRGLPLVKYQGEN